MVFQINCYRNTVHGLGQVDKSVEGGIGLFVAQQHGEFLPGIAHPCLKFSSDKR